jgi:hypothetical protein
MADTKISALTAVASVAGTNEFAVSEAGTSKKASATQIAAFVSPAASDTVAGLIEIAVQSEQETRTDTTRVVPTGRQKFHPSAAQAWVAWTGGSTTILASFGVASIANTATGDADITLSTAFSSATHFAKVSTLENVDGWDDQQCQNSGLNAGDGTVLGVLCSTITDGGVAVCSLTNPNIWFFSAFGDQ